MLISDCHRPRHRQIRTLNVARCDRTLCATTPCKLPRDTMQDHAAQRDTTKLRELLRRAVAGSGPCPTRATSCLARRRRERAERRVQARVATGPFALLENPESPVKPTIIAVVALTIAPPESLAITITRESRVEQRRRAPPIYCMYVCMYTYIYIYIYTSLSLSIYIYIICK